MTTLLRGFNSALSKVSDVLALNQATLSGAIDVVVVETPALHDVLDATSAQHATPKGSKSAGTVLAEALDLEAAHADAPGGATAADGSSSDAGGGGEFDPATDGESLVCTPFHVRFGKLQLLRSREKLVSIRVNDEPMPFCMKLEADGEAYFVLPCAEPPLEEHMLTSPLHSPQIQAVNTVAAAGGGAAQANNAASSLAHPMARSLPELDLAASPATVAAAQQSFPRIATMQQSPVDPASGDAVVAAVRAAGENPATNQEVLLASTVARQVVAANEAATVLPSSSTSTAATTGSSNQLPLPPPPPSSSPSSLSSSLPSSVASSPSRSSRTAPAAPAAPAPGAPGSSSSSSSEDEPGRQLFQIGFGSAAPKLVPASSASVSTVLSPNAAGQLASSSSSGGQGTSMLSLGDPPSSATAGGGAHAQHAKSRSWMRSIFGAMTGGVFSGPDTRQSKEKERGEHRVLEAEQQAANALLFAELAAASSAATMRLSSSASSTASRSASPLAPTSASATVPPSLVASPDPAAAAASSSAYSRSILGAVATADPTPPAVQPGQPKQPHAAAIVGPQTGGGLEPDEPSLMSGSDGLPRSASSSSAAAPPHSQRQQQIDEAKSASGSPLISPQPLPHPASLLQMQQQFDSSAASSLLLAGSGGAGGTGTGAGGIAVAFSRAPTADSLLEAGRSSSAAAATSSPTTATAPAAAAPGAVDSTVEHPSTGGSGSRTLPSSSNISRANSANSSVGAPLAPSVSASPAVAATATTAAPVHQSMSPMLSGVSAPVAAPATAAQGAPSESMTWPSSSLGPFPCTPSLSSEASSSSSSAADGDVALRLSLAGPFLSLTDGVSNDVVFRRYAVSYALLCAQPNLYVHPHLVVLHPQSGGTIYPARLAWPMLIGQLAFNKPLTLSPATVAQIQAMAPTPPLGASPPHAAAAGESGGTSLVFAPDAATPAAASSAAQSRPAGSPAATANTLPGHKHTMSEVVLSAAARNNNNQHISGGTGGGGAPVAAAVHGGGGGGGGGGGRTGWREWWRGKQPAQLGVPPKSASAGPDHLMDAQSPQGYGYGSATSQYNSTESSRAQSPLLSSLTASPSSAGAPMSAATATAASGLLSPPRSSAGLGGPQPAQDVFRHPSGLWLRKTKRPSVSQLARMNLRPGRNRVVFSVNSALQGKQYVECSIFLLKASTRLVVSDIDGTVTRSDVFGQLMPLLGRDWTHGGVASLFHSIARNGFQIVYLTSRAIGQANVTRTYIRGLKQDGLFLPDGPILMSPDRLMASFRREVIDRQPQIFKIMALTELKHLFPPWHNPYYAGFGNRVTDILAYKAVGIPLFKTFIINPAGNIQSINNSYVKTYSQLADMVDAVFPPADAHRVEKTFAAAARIAAAASGVEESSADALEREAARRASLTAEQVMQQLHQAEIEVREEAEKAAGNGVLQGAAIITSPVRTATGGTALIAPSSTSATGASALTTATSAPPSSAAAGPPHHTALVPHAKLLPSTDADLHFNSFAYWRDEIAPLPREPTANDVEEDEDEDEENEDDIEAQRALAASASSGAGAGSPAATLPTGPSPTEFAARVHRQVQAGTAEADAQAAAAAAVVTGEALRDIKPPHSK